MRLWFFFLFLASPAERSLSAVSIQSGTRQRLQYSSTRRVYIVENTNNITSIDLKTNHSIVSTIPATEAKPNVDDNKDKSSTEHDLPTTTPLKHLIFKKITPGPIEVRISFSNI